MERTINIEITDKLIYSATKVANNAGTSGPQFQPLVGIVVSVVAIVVIGYVIYRVYENANADGLVERRDEVEGWAR